VRKDGLDKLVVIFSRRRGRSKYINFPRGALADAGAHGVTLFSLTPRVKKRKEKERERADIAEPVLSCDRYRGQIYGTERSQVPMVSTELIYPAYILNSKHVLRDALNSRI